jgi:Glycosyl hydrolase family 1
MGWSIVPDGLREMLLWVAKTYNNPLIYITENGSAEPEPDKAAALKDYNRRSFFEGHLHACAEAIRGGSNLAGYFAWSLMDNFEWQFGYQRRFGICYVDYSTLERTPKSSALWYQETIGQRGRNLLHVKTGSARTVQSGIGETRRSLRDTSKQMQTKVLLGYGSDCDKVRQAVNDGVNIVIWAFIDIHVEAKSPKSSASQMKRSALQQHISVQTKLNLTAVRDLIDELNANGYNDVLHFVSIGGWNGPHLDPELSAAQWYDTFRIAVGDMFHGIDWDLEGNDEMSSSNNVFTFDCMNKMGEISRLAKEGTC